MSQTQLGLKYAYAHSFTYKNGIRLSKQPPPPKYFQALTIFNHWTLHECFLAGEHFSNLKMFLELITHSMRPMLHCTLAVSLRTNVHCKWWCTWMNDKQGRQGNGKAPMWRIGVLVLTQIKE